MQFADLSTIAEIGATLAGFATLAAAIRGTTYDADAIFDVVAHSLLALIFALCASTFGSTEGMLRGLSALLAVSSSLLLARDIRIILLVREDKSADYDRTSIVVGWLYMLIIAVPPILATTVSINLYPSAAGLLYESALTAQIAASALMLLDVVRRHLAHRSDSPAV